LGRSRSHEARAKYPEKLRAYEKRKAKGKKRELEGGRKKKGKEKKAAEERSEEQKKRNRRRAAGIAAGAALAVGGGVAAKRMLGRAADAAPVGPKFGVDEHGFVRIIPEEPKPKPKPKPEPKEGKVLAYQSRPSKTKPEDIPEGGGEVIDFPKLSHASVMAYWEELTKIAAGKELQILGGLMNRAGLTNVGPRVQQFGREAPERFVNYMMSEPAWLKGTPMEGRHLPGFEAASPMVRRILQAGAHEGPLMAVQIAPTAAITGPGVAPAMYLAARGALGQAAGVPGAGAPHIAVPGGQMMQDIVQQGPRQVFRDYVSSIANRFNRNK
jgi:hypothetical protein